jgi:hypothetical protein
MTVSARAGRIPQQYSLDHALARANYGDADHRRRIDRIGRC